ncbi:uncharacterized protein PGTG_19505 [Puccinia graminis f. sp. tritici CRL 75-36-700-3]|uniref:RING-type domain-containing protein n=1 Tax=Puccinia graminis f. sp. tritici (strain CRL 75-36-700-3 / race SCCL) TaxID=418459 RepID=E3LA53_PUCGT|nr:uncharacterized protein PGTG_19505 [Puccinia graminis f. sp. tritici CRL 75-36-700-3]EFP93428.1 hypothetical protein PGTG_19505 [Puccinia graminis f. sp. tritici CRL 75-36-700-3]
MEVATSHQLASELSNQNLEEVADQNSGVATSHQLASELSNQNLEEVADQNSGVVQWHQSSEIEPVQEAMERRKEFQSKEVQLKSGVTLNSQENCVICLREYQEIEDPESLLVIFPGCEHVFHYTCLKDWFNGRRVIKSLFIHGNSCPICRKLAPTKNYSKFLGTALCGSAVLKITTYFETEIVQMGSGKLVIA